MNSEDDIAFFNTRASDLYATNKSTGEILWKFETEGTTGGFALLAEDLWNALLRRSFIGVGQLSYLYRDLVSVGHTVHS